MVLRKKGQSEILMKGQADFMRSNALGKKAQCYGKTVLQKG